MCVERYQLFRYKRVRSNAYIYAKEDGLVSTSASNYRGKLPAAAMNESGTLASLVIFLALFGGNNGDASCNFDTFVQLGVTYSLENLSYPNYYAPGSSCRWVFRTRWDQRVKIECQDVNMPYSQNCVGNRLEIQDGVGLAYGFCTSRHFPYTSESSRLTINLRTIRDGSAGRFHCTVQAVQPHTCDCGRRNVRKIYGGKETGVNEFPFMAAIVDASAYRIICGGTIINEKQVLTAAHCVAGKRENQFGVLVGAHNLNRVQDTPDAKFLLAKDPILHWSYKGPTSGHDIAIVTVKGQFVFNEFISPVCLPFQHRTDSFANTYTDILGWGADSVVGGPLNVLMKATVTVTSEYTCSSKYPGTSDRHICTQQHDKDSCQFDSGGPLIKQSETSRKIVQIGIMNRGPGCGQGEPALNLRVGQFIDWILTKTPAELRNYCRSE